MCFLWDPNLAQPSMKNIVSMFHASEIAVCNT
jgi:hypothetical protein